MSFKPVLFLFLVTLLSPLQLSCGDDDKNTDESKDTSASDTDTDADTDTDTDVDSDTDTDTDTDSDAGEEALSELTRDTDPDIAETDYQAFIAGTNDFGFDLLRQLTARDANVFFSAVSVATALGMTYVGARDNTRQEMAAVLHNELVDDAFFAAANRLALDLDSRNIAPYETEGGEKNLQLSLVNALFAQKGYAIETPFLDTLAVSYGSGVRLLDFMGDAEGSRSVINGWVADQTNNKIEDLLGPDAITVDTKLVLANALYFYGSWLQVFRTDATLDGPFNTLDGQAVSVPMMHQTAWFPYAEGDGYQIIDLPYEGNKVSMTIVLPEAGRFTEICGLMNSTWLEDARADIASVNVALQLPKFSVTWGSASLRDTLTTLGMNDAFQMGIADFTGINIEERVYISDVLHKAFIGVDESGTEAAAATVVVMDGYSSVPDVDATVTVDRPFLLFIRDASGVLLFTGQVVDPS